MKAIHSAEELEVLLKKEAAVLAYFSHDLCNVCKVLKPKVEELLAEKFPKIIPVFCHTQGSPEIAAAQSVFAVPTLIVWFEGKETYRFGRNVGMQELEEALTRPYGLFFD